MTSESVKPGSEDGKQQRALCFGLERGPGISVFLFFFGPQYRLALPVVLEALHPAQAQNVRRRL